MKGRFRKINSVFGFISLSFFSVSFFQPALAWSSQTDYFIQSIEKSLYNFEFLVEGLNSIDAIEFRTDFTTGYRDFLNEIDLTHTAKNEDGDLKAYLDLSSEDLGDIAHEAFHAFRKNLVRIDSEYDDIKIWMRRRAAIVFPSLPSNKREWALEEAYAVFIGTMVAARLQVEKMLKSESMTCQVRERMSQQYWQTQWNSKIVGYSRDVGVISYWVKAMEGSWIWLNDGRDAYRTFKDQDQDQYEDGNALPLLDKNWIALRLLEGRVSASFQKTFQHNPVFLACIR